MPLVVGTRYNIPFLINKPGVGNYVTGEIYEVDDQMMDVLDNLEDSKRLFKREVQQMNMGIEQGWVTWNSPCNCWSFVIVRLSIICRNVLCNVYLLDKYPEYLLDLPYISEYYNTAKQPYIRKTLRKKTLAEDDFTSSSAASV